MTDFELTVLVQNLSTTFFKQPFIHKVTFNKRLRTTGGRYRLNDHNIEINPKMLTEHDEDILIGVIKHELCHYHLHIAKKGYQHRDRDFKQLLAIVGGSRFAPLSPKKAKKKRVIHYQCSNCGQEYQRQRKINLSRYVCSKCQSKLILMEY
ncbi:SprT family protein [Dellaglioa sp. P0083]|uniref:SprT family protein n=1 Tax=Dellaglioa kimchii TaxID=3344667 RepID=UPI0038D40218